MTQVGKTGEAGRIPAWALFALRNMESTAITTGELKAGGEDRF
jgi:hypothetical protein